MSYDVDSAPVNTVHGPGRATDSPTLPLPAVRMMDTLWEAARPSAWTPEDDARRRRADAVSRRWAVPALLTALDALWAGLGLILAGAVSGAPTAYLPLLAALLLAAAVRNRRRFRLSWGKDAPVLVGAGLVGTGLAVAGAWLVPHPPAARVLAGALVVVGCAVVGRGATIAVGHALRRRGLGLAHAVIIGAKENGTRLGRELVEDSEHGVQVVGIIDDARAARHRGGAPPEPRALSAEVRAQRADLVLVALGEGGCHTFLDPERFPREGRCQVYVVPRVYQEQVRGLSAESVAGLPLVQLRGRSASALSRTGKRALDIVGAGLGLLLSAPLFIVLAVAVRLETGPGCIFRQERVGMHGRPFTLYKLRSLKPVGVEGDQRWSIQGDPRLGRVGRFIRSTSLDELPQLINVLKGDMSLVGPRPERPYFVETFSEAVPGYDKRHRMPVGLTGLAALNGLRGDTGIAERAHYDNLYIDSWSLWLDVKIIVRTALQFVQGRA